MPLQKRTAGTLALVGLLVTAVALSSILTYETVIAERAHRAAVRQAIRDDASIVADDLVRRTVFEFEMFASRPLRVAAADYLRIHPDVPAMDILGREGHVRDLLPLVDAFFTVDTRSGLVEPPQPEPLQSWLRTGFAETVTARLAGNEQQTVRVRLADGEHLLIYGVALLRQGRIFAFVMNDRAVGTLAARAFSRRSTFPGILGRGKLTNADVFLRLSRDSKELFRTPGTFDPRYGTTMTAPPDYGAALGGAKIESSLPERAVPLLIPGGMPASRLPLLAVTVVTSVVVLLSAFAVLRRERQLADMRTDFVSGVSHELRTPLTQIRMFAETLLLDRVRSPEERMRSLQIINEEARRLTNLVDNVLFLSRSPHRPPKLAVGDCDIATLVADAIDAFAPLAMRRDVIVVAETPPQLVARLDGEAWKQVLTNMLDNAVKYGPRGQTVRVQVNVIGNRFRMTVDDEGPGIPPAERQSIWRRFHRLDRDRGTHRSGSGIGLAIVSEILSRHAGNCWVEDAPGGGARFAVEAPLEAGGASASVSPAALEVHA